MGIQGLSPPVIFLYWLPHLMCLINCIEDVQKNFTKKLKGMGNFSYDERLKILNIDRLEIRRIKFDLVLFLQNYK